MYKALDIAYKILKRATNEDSGELISNMKLQKMLYYMQGFHLAYFGQPLFNDEIEAWMYGPVVPCVFDTFTSKGKIGIEYNGDVISLKEEEETLFDKVYDVYMQYSAYGLMELTHKERPWKSVPHGKGQIIPKELIKSYFKTRIKK